MMVFCNGIVKQWHSGGAQTTKMTFSSRYGRRVFSQASTNMDEACCSAQRSRELGIGRHFGEHARNKRGGQTNVAWRCRGNYGRWRKQ